MERWLFDTAPVLLVEVLAIAFSMLVYWALWIELYRVAERVRVRLFLSAVAGVLACYGLSVVICMEHAAGAPTFLPTGSLAAGLAVVTLAYGASWLWAHIGILSRGDLVPG